MISRVMTWTTRMRGGRIEFDTAGTRGSPFLQARANANGTHDPRRPGQRNGASVRSIRTQRGDRVLEGAPKIVLGQPDLRKGRPRARRCMVLNMAKHRLWEFRVNP